MKSHGSVFSSGLRLFLNLALLSSVMGLTGCAASNMWPFNSNHSERNVPPPTADMRAAPATAAESSSTPPSSLSAPALPAPEPYTPSEPESPWVPMPMAPSVPPLSTSAPIEPLAESPSSSSTLAPETQSGTLNDLMPGRYAVQVGVFLVPSNAETIRTRTAEHLANERTLKPSDKEVRSLKKGQRTYVVVGDVPDRNAAEFLAARLRLLLDQDVVVFKR